MLLILRFIQGCIKFHFPPPGGGERNQRPKRRGREGKKEREEEGKEKGEGKGKRKGERKGERKGYLLKKGNSGEGGKVWRGREGRR